MSRRYEDDRDVDIDVVRLFSAVWEQRLAVLSLTLIVSAAAFVISGAIPPRYLGETRILIERREPVYSDTRAGETGPQAIDARGVASQVEIINSTDLIRAVAAELNLADEPDFIAATRPSFLVAMAARMGLTTDQENRPQEEKLIETFRRHLTVYQVTDSRVIVIEFWSTDSQLAATVANRIAETYLTMQSGAKLVTDTDATAWLEPEIAELREGVRLAEEQVAAYRAESGLLLVDDGSTLINRQLADISTELARVRAEKADALARAAVVRRAVERGETSEDFSNVFESEAIQRLRDRRAAVQSTMADLSVTLLDGHPRIKGLRSQLREIDSQISAETRKILRGLQNEAELARIREEELITQLDQLKTASAEAGNEEVELRALEREARAQRQLLEAYLSRYREAASRSDRGNLPADARVIATAIAPSKPYFPKTPAIVIVSALSTLLLSTVFIMLRELLSGRGLSSLDPVRSGESVSEVSEIRPLRTGFRSGSTTVPFPVVEATDPKPSTEPLKGAEASETPASDDVAKEPVEVVGDGLAEPVWNPDPDIPPAQMALKKTEAMDPGWLEPDVEHSVSAIAEYLVAKQTCIAIVVSPEGDKGSTTSVMLARLLANDGHQTLLMDLTGSACPSRMMAPRSELPGITDVLCGDCMVPDALHADRLSNAHILPRGTADPAQAMVHSSELPGIIQFVADAYEIVVIECGPAKGEGIRQLLDEGLVVQMIFSLIQPDEQLITQYLTDFYADGFDDLLMMSPGAGIASQTGRSAA